LTGRDEELARAKREYERRDEAEGKGDRWSVLHLPNLLLVQSRERVLLQSLVPLLPRELPQCRIADIGCGRGQDLLRWLQYGANPTLLSGIDLSEHRVDAAKSRVPSVVDLRVGSADELPWPDGAFDVVAQSTLLSSVLDADVRRAIAAQMLRVLADDGVVVWYDMRRDGMLSSQRWRGSVHAKPIHWFTRHEIVELFPRCDVRLRSLTLSADIGERATRISPLVYRLLDSLPALHSHYLAVITKTRDSGRLGESA
jgi:ubiquinone/menaquinone biosynthesis C-methylase UbiE